MGLQRTAIPAVPVGHAVLGRAAIGPLPGSVLVPAQGLHLRQFLLRQVVRRQAVPGQSFFQIGPESGQIHIFLQERADVADPAANRFGALGLELGRVHVQGTGHHVGIGVKEHSPMVKNPVPYHPLGSTGDLAALHQNIVIGTHRGDDILQRQHQQKRHAGKHQKIQHPAVGGGLFPE